MADNFLPEGLPVLIGSLPLSDHGEAVRLVFDYTPDIPLWVQLPVYPEEGMMRQFLPGMPGLTVEGDRFFIDPDGADYADAVLRFYEEYIAVAEGDTDIDDSRFVLTPETARGFFAFTEHLRSLPAPPKAVKGQVTGPMTFTLGVTDRDRRAIFYDPQARDAAVKMLAMKARWQVKALARFGCPVILFLDEPALAGYGSSELISISREEVAACLGEVVDAVHSEGGLAGIHVCANTDWSLALEGGLDVINFDAYAYFDRFILYADQIRAFIGSGGILTWGIVPTLSPEDLDRETVGSLIARWEKQAGRVAALGIDEKQLLRQSMISPSCGAGSLDRTRALRVLELTKGISEALR